MKLVKSFLLALSMMTGSLAFAGVVVGLIFWNTILGIVILILSLLMFYTFLFYKTSN